MNKRITSKRPEECLPRELNDFKAVVLAGRQVQKKGLDQLIQAAECLGFGFAEEVLASVGAIKKPRSRYRNDVFRKAGSSDDPDAFTLEFGWAHTLPEYEGQRLSSGIADTLLQGVTQPIFATTGETNESMKRILIKRGFHVSGQPYAGRTEKKLLFVRR